MKARRVVVTIELTSDMTQAELKQWYRENDPGFGNEVHQVQVNTIQDRKAKK